MKKLTKAIVLSSLCITASIPAFGMEKNHDFDSFFGRAIGRGKLPMPSGSMKKDGEAAYELIDQPTMTQNVKEASTGKVASKKMHSIFDKTTGSSGKSIFPLKTKR